VAEVVYVDDDALQLRCDRVSCWAAVDNAVAAWRGTTRVAATGPLRDEAPLADTVLSCGNRDKRVTQGRTVACS